jgi:hypothetical protein
MFEDDDEILKSMIQNIWHPTSGNIDRDKLEAFMLGLVDKMQNNKPIENDVKKLLSATCKLWREKESWKQMYYDMANRYNDHLDQELATYRRMLGHRR